MYKNYTSMFLGRDTQLRKEITTRKGHSVTKWLFSMMLLVGMLTGFDVSAQVTVTNPGNTTPALNATYGSLAAAITDVNNRTAISGPVTITLNAGNPQTAPSGGYSLTNTAITGGSNTNRITFEGSGNTITAAVPAGTAGNLNDGFFKVIGADFITIQNFVMNESASNTVTTAGTNTMMEWGVALLYSTTTNGAQGITIQGNTITLNRTYQNTFGIYSNSTHALATIATSATATTTAGGNSNLKVYSNTISNVNNGIVIVGPTAVADANTGIEIGGASLGNSITNFGTTGTFSGYANVSGTVNGILIRNSNGYIISNNTITSSVGGTTTATLNGIQQAASTNAPTATFTNTINNNNISLQSGLASGTMVGITVPSGSASVTSVMNINGNNFNTFGHTVAGTGAITFITLVSTHFTTSISNNTFTNISVNTTGSVAFITQSFTAAANGTKTTSGNSIVGTFAKTGAGGTINLILDNGSTNTGSTSTCQNNNFSNGTLTGATTLTGISYTDGGTAPARTVTGNTINNWTTGAATINAMNFTYWNGVSSLSNNTVTNLTGQGAITGITMGSTVNTATSVTVASNTITNLTSTGTGGAVTGISCANTSTLININNNTITTLSSTGASAVVGITVTGATTTNVFKNTISNLAGTNASSTVSGISVSSGTTVSVSNNRIGDLRATVANAANPLNGINITGGTTVNVYYNTVYLNATSSGALFGSSAISASSTPTLTLNNNNFVNASTANGAGLTVAYRRSSATLTTYGANSERNNFFASTVYTDGTTPQVTIGAYKTLVGPTRDANAVSTNPSFLSTVSGNANFLKIDTAIATQLESGAANISGITDDFENDIRFGNPGYAGTGTAPDIGADEFNGTPASVCNGTPAASTINGLASVCTGTGTTLSLSTIYTDLQISYAWFSGTTPGGPYPTALGTGTTQATGTLTANTYYIAVITCGNSGLSFTTAEKSVLINALPTVTLTPSSASFCTPGGSPVALTAGGAVSYTYTNNSSLTPSSGANVSAAPGSTTTYVVTGTDANGCTNTASSTVSVLATPTGVTASASPATICKTEFSTLTATANAPIPTVVSSYTFDGTGTGAALDAMSGATTVISSPAVSSGVGDDSVSSLLTLPFTFNFNGVDYTQYTLSPDGWIKLGSPVGTAEFTNAVASTSNLPKIYPLWDDLSTGLDGNVKTLTTGTAPNRVFKIQWLVTVPRVVAGNANSTFQLWMYEGSNKVEFRYGALGTAASASAGMTGGATNFQSISYATNTASTATANNTNTTGPASGRLYSFAPQSAVLTYSWAGTITSLVSPNTASTDTAALEETETFTVTVSNGGCSATGQTTVTVSEGAAITTDPVASTKCAGQTATFTVVATGPGLTYQWRKDGIDIPVGGNASAGTATLTLTNVTAADIAGYDVVVGSSCGDPVSSAVASLSVNELPIVTLTPSTGTYCVPGGTAVALTAGGALSYTYTNNSSLTPSSGANVSAAPSTTTTYVVTGTDANSCTNTASATVTVSPVVTLGAATATPSTVCSGGTSQLATTLSSAINYTVASNTLSPVDKTGLTAGTFTTAPTGDDAISNSVPIGFNFNFYGTDYSTFVISTNANIQFGNPPVSVAWTAQSIPNSTTPTAGASGNTGINNYIALAWRDWTTVGAGEINYYTTGTAPNRICLIDFNDTGNFVGQIVLHEGSNVIDIISTNLASNTSVQGIENAGGTAGVAAPARNNVAWSSTTTSSYTFSPSVYTYAWTPSTFLSDATIVNPVASNVTATTTYSVTASAGGCTSAPSTVTVTVSAGAAVTADPVATTKCAGQTATFSVTATGPGLTYQWRKDGVDIPVGSNASAGTATLSLSNVTAADAATYDVVVSSTCGSPATSAGAALTVTPNPTATAGSNSPVCTTGTINLTGGTDIGTTFAWTGPNGFTSTDQNPSIAGATMAAAGVYSFTATANGCTSTASTTTVVVNQTPSAVTITPPSATICSGSSVGLVASGGSVNATSSTLGAGTTSSAAATTGATLGPNPLQSYYGGSKQQMIVLASELTGLGLSNGSVINSVAFNLSVAETGRTLQNLQVKVSNTALSAFASTTFAAAGTVVRNAANFTVATGWNTIAFDSGFTWDGSSNIIIEVNFSNNDGGGSGTSTAVYSTTGFASTLFYRVDNNTASAVDAATTASFAAYTQRNNLRLGTLATGSFAWTPPASGLDVYTGTTVSASPTGTTTYTATSTVNGCSSQSDVTVTVNPNYTITASAGSNGSVTPSGATTVCSGGSQAYTIAADSGYHILDVLVDAVSQGAITTYTFSNVTANHTISATFETDCNNVALASASANTNPVCSNATTTLSATGLAGTGAVLNWFTGTGGTGTNVGTGLTSNPVGPGTYYAYATGNCGAPVEIEVVVNSLPAPTVTAGDVSGCSGTDIDLIGSPAGGTFSVANPYNGTSSTTYTYTYTAPNGCTATSASANITITAQPQWFLDADGDHYYTGAAVPSCASPGAGYTTSGLLGGGDCNDGDNTIYPNAPEICWNNILENCLSTMSFGCAPVIVNMTPSYNNTTLPSLSTAVPAVAYTYPGATNLKYRFSITNVTSGAPAVEVIQTSRFVTIPASLHLYGAAYDIKVSAVINDEVVPYAGNTIRVNGPTVQLITLNSATCGATLASLTSTLTANTGLNATGYTFRIRLNDSNPSPTYAFSQSSTRFVTANSFTGFPLQYGASYKVSVQYTFTDPVTTLPVDSGYGTECTVNTPSIPLTTLASPTCGSQVATLNANISAAAASYATGYQFRIRLFSDNGPTPTYYYTVPNASRFSSLTAFQGITLAYNTAYSISVQYSINNGGTVWSGYGPDCKVTTPFFPVTSLVPSQCGLATPTSLTQQLNITPYPGFPHYMVKLEELSGEDVVNSQEREITYSYFKLSDFSIAQLGKNYAVSVKIKLNGVFGDYDTACDLFTPAPGKTAMVVPFKATAYPNPFANNFMLDVKTASQSLVNLKVYDMVGRLIEQRDVRVSDMETTTIGDRYPSGVYNVVVSQEDSVETVRVVKR